MTGRELFTKHGAKVKILINVAKCFPKSFCQSRFEAACMDKGIFGQLKRYIWISTLAKSVGDNVAIFPNVYFMHLENLSIGNNVSIHQMCYIDAGGEIIIGDNVSIAHRTTILSSNHRYNEIDKPIKYQGMIYNKTTIDDNIWIGCGVTILAGVHIYSGSVVGANSLVTKDVLKDSVVVGNPARCIKSRSDSYNNIIK